MLEIRIHGRGGQGAVLASQILSYAFFLEGKYSQSFPTFGAERRGAPVSAFVRISDSFINIRSQVVSPHHVIVLSSRLADTVDVTSGIKNGGTVLINSLKPASSYKFSGTPCRVFTLNINEIALKYSLGTKIMPMVNAPVLGAFARITDLLSVDSLLKALPHFIPANVDRNKKALHESYYALAENNKKASLALNMQKIA